MIRSDAGRHGRAPEETVLFRISKLEFSHSLRPVLPFAVDADATGTERDQNGKGETAGETARAPPIRIPRNLLKILEAGTGIEPVFTDLQSALVSLRINMLG